MYCGALRLKKPPALFEFIVAPETLMYGRSCMLSILIGINCGKIICDLLEKETNVDVHG